MTSPTKDPEMQAQLTRTQTIWEELCCESLKDKATIDFNIDPDGELDSKQDHCIVVDNCDGFHGVIMFPGHHPRVFGRKEAGKEAKYSIKAYAPGMQEDSPNDSISNHDETIAEMDTLSSETPPRTGFAKFVATISKGAKRTSKATTSALKSTARTLVVSPARKVSKAAVSATASVRKASSDVTSSISKGARRTSKATTSALKSTARTLVVSPARKVSKAPAAFLNKLRKAFRKN